MIVGTAGHIDHGKTALVRALTGVDTDRLPEEKRRGITIELGFAPLPLGAAGVAGVVDVPGHEAFVRTMLAGATGVDVALLVVAADEGVMPQTREHLAILALLGVRRAVVALTKADLVDDEWLTLVADDVRATLAAAGVEALAVVPTSVVTGAGIEGVRDALAVALAGLPARDGDDLFRLPVDRAFTVKGVGTVVTGTVWSGALARDAHVRLLPSMREVRVRHLQSHGREVARVGPGTRAAVALVGVEVAEVGRGTVLVAGGGWRPADVWRADVTLLGESSRAIGPRTALRLHLGTTEVGARVVAAGGRLEPGGMRAARVVLDAPVAARAGDRFVLRGGSPLTTLGGGVVRDPLPGGRRVRPFPVVGPSPAATLALLLDTAGGAGVPVADLPIRLGVAPAGVGALLADPSAGLARVEEVVVSAGVLAALRERALALVDAHHGAFPLEPGLSRQALRLRLEAPSAVADAAVARLVTEGTVELDGARVRRAGWVPAPSADQSRLLSTLEARLAAAGLELPTVAELTGELGRDVPALLALSVRSGRSVVLDSERVAAAAVVTGAVGRLAAHLVPGTVYTPGAVREVLGVSRKYLMSVLEFLDREGLTEKTPEGRRWRAGGDTSGATSTA
ncbi:selenocysteine-specific translation elongation factor [Roseisolibacter sp. H3M3-2]|uniref:selenocysteine-specific translation elongation factor n=1 Tax=Roseisolibacter sp. H3M3-2 TaxID=3031323 RepID=UPI0023DAA0E6|nr:selenocysteine-specific translation elongation factor [Roseisolibacter sp. H3M3-2]MDF1502259.1 selenocysteine-specific translation elongation factor [Roseisolibacter sp. H3M3-2]